MWSTTLFFSIFLRLYHIHGGNTPLHYNLNLALWAITLRGFAGFSNKPQKIETPARC
jgi:hypothetical protein